MLPDPCAREDFAAHDESSGRLFLLRRPERRKYKAGNIAHFLERHGDEYDFFLVLDADSMMGGKTVRRMIRRLETSLAVAMIQSTVVPIRSVTPFARSLEYSTRRCLPLYARGMHWFLGRDSVYWLMISPPSGGLPGIIGRLQCFMKGFTRIKALCPHALGLYTRDLDR